MAKILITGAKGYIGSALLKELALDSQFEILGVSREKSLEDLHNYVIIPSIEASTDWAIHLRGVDCVIHLAGIAHKSNIALEDFRRVNTFGTLNLARQARLSGVKRFIFISSIGVNGNYTSQLPFDEMCIPSPHSIYAVSKFEAEHGLWEIAGDGMDIVVIRPPLVYGEGAPGNFSKLLKIVSLGLPLPIGGIKNKRSMIAIENLISFIKICISHPLAANELYVVADEDSLSLQEIIGFIAKGMNIDLKIWKIPASLLEITSNLLGKKDIFMQLSKSLVINSHKARSQLGWTPSIKVGEALIGAGKSFALKSGNN